MEKRFALTHSHPMGLFGGSECRVSASEHSQNRVFQHESKKRGGLNREKREREERFALGVREVHGAFGPTEIREIAR